MSYVFTLDCLSSGEGNGNPLHCSCLENPVDGGAWWAAVHGVARSQTRLKRLSMQGCIGEGNGNPLQYSCLENPRDRGAWWAAIYGVMQSRTRLKWLSSSSSCLSSSWFHLRLRTIRTEQISVFYSYIALLIYVNGPIYLLGNLPFFKIPVSHFMAQDDSSCANVISRCMLWVRSLVPLWVWRHFLSLINSLLIGT